jgi:AraC-like DNA-binding protein
MNSHLYFKREDELQFKALESKYRAVEFANLCQVCPKSLQEFFQTRFGVSPKRWLRKVRCEEAARRILKGDLHKCIASELFFTDESHFYREFKHHFKITPTEFEHFWSKELGAEELHDLALGKLFPKSSLLAPQFARFLHIEKIASTTEIS